MYQNEFDVNTRQLNMAGQDHVKQLAARLLGGQDLPVVVERSLSTARETTEHKYSVHPNPQLDMMRRDVIVRSLTAMGVSDADQRVVVAPALTPGYTSPEAERAYYQSFQNGLFGRGGFGGSGFGNFGSGGFGFGGIGGFF